MKQTLPIAAIVFALCVVGIGVGHQPTPTSRHDTLPLTQRMDGVRVVYSATLRAPVLIPDEWEKSGWVMGVITHPSTIYGGRVVVRALVRGTFKVQILDADGRAIMQTKQTYLPTWRWIVVQHKFTGDLPEARVILFSGTGPRVGGLAALSETLANNNLPRSMLPGQ